MKDQLCPKCATGVCAYRDGIMCRGVVCQRDDISKTNVTPEMIELAKSMGILNDDSLTRLSTFALSANFFRRETPRDAAVGRESTQIAVANAV